MDINDKSATAATAAADAFVKRHESSRLSHICRKQLQGRIARRQDGQQQSIDHGICTSTSLTGVNDDQSRAYTAFPAQHLRPSGVLSCWSDGTNRHAHRNTPLVYGRDRH